MHLSSSPVSPDSSFFPISPRGFLLLSDRYPVLYGSPAVSSLLPDHLWSQHPYSAEITCIPNKLFAPRALLDHKDHSSPRNSLAIPRTHILDARRFAPHSVFTASFNRPLSGPSPKSSSTPACSHASRWPQRSLFFSNLSLSPQDLFPLSLFP